MSDTMHIAYQLNMHYVDMLKPQKHVSAKEIIDEVVTKGGLNFE